MHSSFSLQIISFHKIIEDFNLLSETRNLFERCGYEIVLSKEQDNYQVFNSLIQDNNYSYWLLVVDILPWIEKKTRLDYLTWNLNSTNYRTDWAIYTVHRFLKEHNKDFAYKSSDLNLFNVIDDKDSFLKLLFR